MMLKAGSKFRLIIAFYMSIPIGIILLFMQGSPVLHHPRFQEALGVCFVVFALPMLCSPLLLGLNWLFLRQIRQIDRVCADVKNGKYTLFSVPNEPLETGDENEMIFLMRNMNWMIRRIESRESELEGRVAQRTRELEKKNAKLIIARDEAKASAKAKSMFLATMSHEIRTPLNAMIGMSELVLGSPLSSSQKEQVLTINSASKSLLRILNDILDFSKLDARKMALEPRQTNLRQLLKEAADMFSPQAEEKGLELFLNPDPDLPGRVSLDALRLKQVLNNLLSNAIKFTSRGQIHLQADLESFADDNARIRFCVRDTGMGMEEKNIKKLFSPFTQADSSITRQFGGTGLGLAISKEIVSLMGGEMRVKTQPGQGSCFCFTVVVPVLSLEREEAAPAAEGKSINQIESSADYKPVVCDAQLSDMISQLEVLIEQNSLRAKACVPAFTEKLSGTIVEKQAHMLESRIKQFDFSGAHIILGELKKKIADNSGE